MQVLYVDDDILLAKSVEQMLQREGYFCHSANDGKQALALAKRNKYDVIILDIMLPDIDGYEVVRQLRAIDIRTPILLQSGVVDHQSEPEGHPSKNGEFLFKPFKLSDLTVSIKRTIEGAQSAVLCTPAYQPGPAKRLPEGGPERRRHRRFTTLKTAHIVDSDSVMECIVLNMSHGGAALRLSGGGSVRSANFPLKLDSGTVRYCEVRWRYKDKIGVRFTASLSEGPRPFIY